MNRRAMRRRQRRTQRAAAFYKRGLLPYRHARAVWPMAVPQWPGPSGWRSFRVPYNTARWLAAAPFPMAAARRNRGLISTVVAAIVWHVWAVALAVTGAVVAVVCMALTVASVGLIKAVRWVFRTIRSRWSSKPNPPPPPCLPTSERGLLDDVHDLGDIDPVLLDPEAADVHEPTVPTGPGIQIIDDDNDPMAFTLDESGDLLDPVQRTAFDLHQRRQERAEHHALLDRIEAVNHQADVINQAARQPAPVPAAQPVFTQTPASDPDAWLGPFIAGGIAFVFLAYALLAVGAIAWADARIDSIGAARVDVTAQPDQPPD